MSPINPPAAEISLLGPLIDAATVARRLAEDWGVPRSTYASKLDGCAREIVFARLGYPKVEETRGDWARSAASGNRAHEYYQSLLQDTGVIATTAEVLAAASLTMDDFADYQRKKMTALAIEIPLPASEVKQFSLGGKGDVIIKTTVPVVDPESGEVIPAGTLVVVEIKTVKSKYYNQITKQDKWDGFYSQSQLYMHFLNIKWTIVLLVNRNEDTVKELLIPYDSVYCHEREQRLLRIDGHVKARTLPAPEPGERGERCRFCPFKLPCEMENLRARVAAA